MSDDGDVGLMSAKIPASTLSPIVLLVTAEITLMRARRGQRGNIYS